MNAAGSDGCSNPEMFFFPYVGGGHFLPMVDLSRVFASHLANSTIVVPPSAAAIINRSITRDKNSGLNITLRVLQVSADSDNATDMSAGPFRDTTALLDPLRRLLTDLRPHCLVADLFHRWVADLAEEIGIPLIIFNGNGCFSRCAEDCIRRYKPHEAVDSDFDSFLIPGLPDRIQLTRSQLPFFGKMKPDEKHPDRMAKVTKNSFGVLVNSFYELEPAYADYFRNEIANRAWIVGPASLCNKSRVDKVERGGEHSSINRNCTSWLDSKLPRSVLYISFGSVVRLPPRQILEIAHGLEASKCPFVWAVGKVLGKEGDDEDCLPEGYVARVSESGRGLIIKGWAPQLMILGHSAVGGFLTHCGWNSTTEAVTAGVPVVTWPLSAEQFLNEKLLTEVLKVGVGVGSLEWASWDADRTLIVGREKVTAAIGKVMDGGEEAAGMKIRMKELAEKGTKAVEEGGLSYADAEKLIVELKALRSV